MNIDWGAVVVITLLIGMATHACIKEYLSYKAKIGRYKKGEKEQ